jgi:hypothetical protein
MPIPAHLPPPLPVSQLDRRGTGGLRKRGNLMTGEGWAWSRIIRPQESLALCKSFNPLWVIVSNLQVHGVFETVREKLNYDQCRLFLDEYKNFG